MSCVPHHCPGGPVSVPVGLVIPWRDILQWYLVVSCTEAATLVRPFTHGPPPSSPGLSLAAPQLRSSFGSDGPNGA